MSLDRYTQKVNIKAAEHRKLLEELKQLAVSVERCMDTISGVMAELTAVNSKYQGQRTTRDEVDYLTVLLDCAKKKLAWEKQIGSLRKRSPVLLGELMKALNDKDFPPSEEMKAQMLNSLQAVQGALERLQGIPVSDESADGGDGIAE